VGRESHDPGDGGDAGFKDAGGTRPLLAPPEECLRMPGPKAKRSRAHHRTGTGAGQKKMGLGGIKVRVFRVHSRKKSGGLWHVCLPSTRRPAQFVFRGVSQRLAEILPVQRPPTLAVGTRVMRLMRILVFRFFSLSIVDQLPLHRGAFHNAQKTSLETGAPYTL